MKTRVVGGVLFAVLCSLQALGQVGVWKNYTSMQSVRGIARSGDTFWAATSGGLFAWKEGTTEYQKFTSAEGLQSTDLTAVAVDNNGDVWTGTPSGTIHVYSPTSNIWRYVDDLRKVSDIDRRINSIDVFGDTVLISTNFGLSVFRVSRFQFGDTFRKFGTIPPSARVAVSSAAIFDGKIWATVADGQGTNRVANASLSTPNILPAESWTLQLVGSALTIPRKLAVFNNRLYATSSSGLFFSNANSWTALDSLLGTNLTALSLSATKLGCIGNDGRVYTLSTQNVLDRFGPSFSVPPSSITFNSAGNPIVGTASDGIAALVNSTWTYYFPNGPAENSFVSITVDLDRNVWGAPGLASSSGFFKFDGKTWRSFNRISGARLPADNYFRVSAACNGDVWASSWGSGSVLVPRGAQQIDTALVFGANVGISDIGGQNAGVIIMGPGVCDKQGNTWFSVHEPSNKNVLAIHKAGPATTGWSTIPVRIGGANGSSILSMTNDNVPRPIAIDESGSIWGASVKIGDFGLMCLNNRGALTDTVAETFLTTANGLPDNGIRCVVVDKDNDVWVGTDRGIGIILDPAAPTRSGGIASYKPLNQGGTTVNAIAVDALNQKWVATTEGVVLLSRDGTQTLAQYNVANTNGKLIDNDVKDIAIDNETGTVYFATTKGLSSLTTSSVQPKESFDVLVVYPNPFRVPSNVPLTIDGLVENSKVKILSVDGHLVREIQTPGGRIGFWDGKDEKGNDVASGVYIVVGYSDSEKGNTGKGKVAVLRK